MLNAEITGGDSWIRSQPATAKAQRLATRMTSSAATALRHGRNSTANATAMNPSMSGTSVVASRPASSLNAWLIMTTPVSRRSTAG